MMQYIAFAIYRDTKRSPLVPTHQSRCALTCSSLHTCHSTHMEPPGLFMAAFTQFMAFWGRFEPSWRPPMAILGGKIDPNTLAQVCLDMFQS